MADKFEKALYEDVVSKYGDEAALEIFQKLEEMKGLSDGGSSYNSALGKLKDSIRSKLPKGFTEKISSTMRGKGSTEVIKDAVNKIKGLPGQEAGNLKMVSGAQRLEKVAKHRALRKLQKEATESAFDVAGKGLKSLGKVAGKFGKGALKAIPLVGPAIAGGLTLATTGDAQAALGEAFDSEALGEGSDETKDLGLSRADLGIAERKTIEAMEERKEEKGSDRLKALLGTESEAPSREELLKGKKKYKFNVLGE